MTEKYIMGYVEWPLPEQFDWPEFFDSGLVAYATDTLGIVDVPVYRCGEADMIYMGRSFRTAEQFRDGFPDGVLPNNEDAEWVFNGWFEVDAEEDGDGEIFYSLKEASVRALEILKMRMERE